MIFRSFPGIPDASIFYRGIVNFLKVNKFPIQPHCQNENNDCPLEKGIMKPLMVWKNMIVRICMLIKKIKITAYGTNWGP